MSVEIFDKLDNNLENISKKFNELKNLLDDYKICSNSFNNQLKTNLLNNDLNNPNNIKIISLIKEYLVKYKNSKKTNDVELTTRDDKKFNDRTELIKKLLNLSQLIVTYLFDYNGRLVNKIMLITPIPLKDFLSLGKFSSSEISSINGHYVSGRIVSEVYSVGIWDNFSISVITSTEIDKEYYNFGGGINYKAIDKYNNDLLVNSVYIYPHRNENRCEDLFEGGGGGGGY